MRLVLSQRTGITSGKGDALRYAYRVLNIDDGQTMNVNLTIVLE